jgi:hypothetical protein
MKISIINAEYQGDYKIKLSFSDYLEKIINFKKFLMQSSNPMIRKYLDENLFSNYSIIHGDLIWNDYELCFPIWDLYKGNL